MRKQTFNKISKTNSADLATLQERDMSKDDMAKLDARIRLGFILMNEEHLRERDYAAMQMRGVAKKLYTGKLKDIFPDYTKLQRIEIKQSLKSAGFKFDGKKITGFKPR